MKTHFISEGQSYRNIRFHRTKLNKTHRAYLRKITKWNCPIWEYFTAIEDDFRLLHKPFANYQLVRFMAVK